MDSIKCPQMKIGPIISSGHTHAIVSWLTGRWRAVLWDGVRGVPHWIWLTNICSFMVIFSQLCKHISPGYLLAALALLIPFWRSANLQTLFCLSARTGFQRESPLVFCQCEGETPMRGKKTGLFFNQCVELICYDCSSQAAIVVNDCCS